MGGMHFFVRLLIV